MPGSRTCAFFGHDGPGSLGSETHDEADLAGRSSDFIPGEPQAVRVAQPRFAVMGREIGGSEDEFLFGMRSGTVGIIEGVDDEVTFNDDGGFSFAIVKHESSAEAANAPFAGLFENGVGPECGDATGDFRFVRSRLPGDVSAEVEFGAADGRHQQQRENERESQTS